MHKEATVFKKYKAFILLLGATLLVASTVYSQDDQGEDQNHDRGQIQRVLLISIDGMHAVDFENCAKNNTCPTLASLGHHGLTYTRASASKPSDSFPGLMNIVTGGTPKTHGAFYDVAYDRSLAPPATDTGNGLLHGPCTPGVINGTTTEYEEGVDINQALLNGGATGATLTDGGFQSIDASKLPRDPSRGCAAVYPWNFIRANTIFGVIHAAGGRTAWSDKHPVYASVSGPTGTSVPSNVDDYYSPEINSTVVGLPGVSTPITPNHPNGVSCATVRDPAQTGSWTDSFLNIQCYDTLKVNAVVNWIKGRSHLGTSGAGVPTLFGMNFQSVSVGQKLLEGGVAGGYTDNTAKPTAAMLDEIEFVDASLGKIVDELDAQRLLNSTLIIITAKHGQSPIDPHQVNKIGGNSPAHMIHGNLPASEDPTGSDIGPTEDDISLLWLANSATTASSVATLEAGASLNGVGEIFYGSSLTTMFNAPGLPPLGDPRTPDIIVQPNVGVIYSTSSKKQAEHGGFAHDDTNVMLLISNPSMNAKTITSAVETTQIAPSILKVLGMDPNSLQAVRSEGTPVLPGLLEH
jgi:hypothetical protein